MLIRTLSSVSESISIPTQVRLLLSAIPNVDVRLIDYDYIGNAKEADFASFANYYAKNLILIYLVINLRYHSEPFAFLYKIT